MTWERTSSKRSKKKLIIAIVAVLVLVGIYLFVIRDNNKPAPVTQANAAVVKVVPSGITYPSSWKESSTILLEDKQAGVISVASRSNPDVSVFVREVDTPLAKDFNIQTLPDQASASLKKGVDGFTLKQKGFAQIGSYKAVKIEYTSTTVNSSESTSTMFIIPEPQRTFYVTYQSAGDVSKINVDVNKINLSVANIN